MSAGGPDKDFGSIRYFKSKFFIRGINTFNVGKNNKLRLQLQSNLYGGHILNISDPNNQYQGQLPLNDNLYEMNVKGHKAVGYIYNNQSKNESYEHYPICGENLGLSQFFSTQHKLLLLPP